MKITLDVSDQLLAEARQLARATNVTLRELFEDGLREALTKRRKAGKKFRLRDASFKRAGQGLQPPFDERRWAEIRAASYAGRGV